MDFNFFGIGLPELFTVAMLALLVLGPKRMTQHAFQLGRMVRQLRELSQGVFKQFQDEIAPLAQDETIQSLRGVGQELSQMRNNLIQAVQLPPADKVIGAHQSWAAPKTPQPDLSPSLSTTDVVEVSAPVKRYAAWAAPTTDSLAQPDEKE